jgi:hypothetical protein
MIMSDALDAPLTDNNKLFSSRDTLALIGDKDSLVYLHPAGVVIIIVATGVQNGVVAGGIAAFQAYVMAAGVDV